MKKLVFAIAALGLFSMTSCKKDYTCTCTVNGISASTTIKDTKSKAKEACEKGSSTTTVGGTTFTTTCAIK